MITRMTIGRVALAAAFCAASATAAMAQAAPGRGVPAMPGDLEVPDGFTLFLSTHAEGTQNYICLPAASGSAWKLFGPEATLYDTGNGAIHNQRATHFLSMNPDEPGLARPTWQHSLDSSRVWAKLKTPSADPAFVAAGAIPWLLLERVGAAPGPDGSGILTRTAYIQRLNTSGGAAPAAGCGQPSDVGAVALVPYSADYFFYRKRGGA